MKQRLLPIVIIGLTVLLGLGLLIALMYSGDPGKEDPSDVQSFEIQGQDHIEVGASHPGYNSNPPTSGPHYAEPADWGAYQEELPDEQLVHNLEHGGIWISYKGVDERTKRQLEDVARANPGSVIVTPRSRNDAPIVLASWGKLLKLQQFDEGRIRSFIDQYKNQSPEPVAR